MNRWRIPTTCLTPEVLARRSSKTWRRRLEQFREIAVDLGEEMAEEAKNG